MLDYTSPRTGLTYLAAAQAQKHVTVNETFRRLDAIVQAGVVSATVNVQPASPNEGDAWILPPGATGPAWGAMSAGSLAAFQDGAFVEISPWPGFLAFAADTGTLLVFDGSAWSEAGGGARGPLTELGVNTAPDATNKLAVKSDATLFSHDDVTPGTGDMRQVLNKATAGGTVSQLYQTAFSGRAETGLTGDDDFHLKVSPDGATWHEALVADKDDGRVTAPSGLLVPGGQNIKSQDTPIGSSEDAALELEGGGLFGRVALVVKSVIGLTGALFEQRSTHPLNIDLIDFGFKTLTHQMNLRVEGRPSPNSFTGAPEFQIGDLGDGSAPITNLLAISTKQAFVQVPFRLKSYTVATLPAPATIAAGAMVYVSNAAGGAVPAFNDGTSWRRVTDRTVVT